MSYTTTNAHGDYHTVYHRRTAPNANPTWWPDFGPGGADFSFQREASATQSIYENHTVHHSKNSQEFRNPKELAPTKQFRHPNPSVEALFEQRSGSLNDVAFLNAALARGKTARQGALSRLEVRAKQVDKWVEDAPILSPKLGESVSSSSGTLRSASLPNLSSLRCARASRDTYARHGFVGGPPVQFRRQDSRKHHPLSFNKMLFSGELFARRSPGQNMLESRSLKPIPRDWRICPESSYELDVSTGLPVTRNSVERERESKERERERKESERERKEREREEERLQVRLCGRMYLSSSLVGQSSLAETTASTGAYSDEAKYAEPSIVFH